MEYAEAGFTAGFGREIGLKSTTKVCLDDFWSPNAPDVASCDDFFVDQLLDFSNEDGFVKEEPEPEEEEEEEELFKDSYSSVSVSVSASSPPKLHETSNQSSSSSAKDDFWSVSSRDFEDLEWLSHIVADPVPTYILTEKPHNPNQTRTDTEIAFSCLKTPFPSKPRSKRTRIHGRLWTLVAPFTADMSSSSCSSPPRLKKLKRKPTVEGTGAVQSGRRCCHCGVQKTPQWRAGPMGAKTLCNACGVRFKSGRLFPEYRPACSPTFSSELHSNHHRKVLEMRRSKDTEKEYSGLTQPEVPSF